MKKQFLLKIMLCFSSIALLLLFALLPAISLAAPSGKYVTIYTIQTANNVNSSAVNIYLLDGNGDTFTKGNGSNAIAYNGPVYINLPYGVYNITGSQTDIGYLMSHCTHTNNIIMYNNTTITILGEDVDLFVLDDITLQTLKFTKIYSAAPSGLTGNAGYNQGFSTGYAEAQQEYTGKLNNANNEIASLRASLESLQNSLNSGNAESQAKIASLQNEIAVLKQTANNAYNAGLNDNDNGHIVNNAIKLGFNGFGMVLTQMLTINFLGIPLYIFCIVPILIGGVLLVVKLVK